jgi:hypothetical protein
MMTMTQTSRLLAWVIAGLIVVGILLYFFGPVDMRTDEIIVVSLVILGLLGFLVWLRWRASLAALARRKSNPAFIGPSRRTATTGVGTDASMPQLLVGTGRVKGSAKTYRRAF